VATVTTIPPGADRSWEVGLWEVGLWEVGAGKPLGPPWRHRGLVKAMAFSPDGKTVVTGCPDKSARLWEVETGKPLGLPWQHRGPVYAVAFSPDGKAVLTGSDGS